MPLQTMFSTVPEGGFGLLPPVGFRTGMRPPRPCMARLSSMAATIIAALGLVAVGIYLVNRKGRG